MRIHDKKPDYFDLHRKDHEGRPALIALAFLGSLAVWAAVILLIARTV
jgi:hypothetical protein